MNSRGFSTVEAAIIFPIVFIIISIFIMLVIKYTTVSIDVNDTKVFSEIKIVDSLHRKAKIVGDIFE